MSAALWKIFAQLTLAYVEAGRHRELSIFVVQELILLRYLFNIESGKFLRVDVISRNDNSELKRLFKRLVAFNIL